MSALFHAMDEFCRRPREKGKGGIFASILACQEQLAAKLEIEGAPLWRYSGGTPFDQAQWQENLSAGWKKKGSFPSLYHDPGVYDKREVVVCFLLASGVTLAQADRMLDELSTRNQSYEGRRLYPLHFKEAFFRLILAWNERHPIQFSFPQAVAAYQDYEEALLKDLKQRWDKLERQRRIAEQQADASGDFDFSSRCHRCAAELWRQTEGWAHPLRLAEQDDLQRLIVLIAHEERALEESIRKTDGDFLKRNLATRPSSQRGTRLCQSIIERCAGKESWEDAASEFRREAIPAIGEAYWRAASWVMKAYAGSGGKGDAASPYVREHIRSARNKRARQFKAVSVFSENPEIQSLSFSLDLAQLKKFVKENTANTVLVAELMRPMPRRDMKMFGQPDSNVPQAAISLFLNGYRLWLEGKTGMWSQGGRRTPMPFYDFKRETVIKYALACGCKSRAELCGCLEFSGCGALNSGNPAESLVQEALRRFEELPFREKNGTSPISVLMDMQLYLFYFSAREFCREHGHAIDPAAIKKQIRNLRRGLLYEPDLPEWSGKGGPTSKQERMEGFLTLSFLAALALEYISSQSDSPGAAHSLAEAVLAQWETGGEYGRDVSDGFLLFMDGPQTAGRNYVRYRMDDPVWAMDFSRPRTPPDTVYLSELLRLVSRYIALPGSEQAGNSSVAKAAYEGWFLILSMLAWAYGPEIIESIPAAVKLREELQDSAVLWTFLGGVRSFSISFYEQHFRLNHFAEGHIGADRVQGSRWLRYLHELTGDIEIWDAIATDAGIIRRCYEYIQKRNIETFVPAETEYVRFQKNLNDICEILERMENGLGDGEEELRLKKRYAYLKKKVKYGK